MLTIAAANLRFSVVFIILLSPVWIPIVSRVMEKRGPRVGALDIFFSEHVTIAKNKLRTYGWHLLSTVSRSASR